jgi:hypothetical protein
MSQNVVMQIFGNLNELPPKSTPQDSVQIDESENVTQLDESQPNYNHSEELT